MTQMPKIFYHAYKIMHVIADCKGAHSNQRTAAKTGITVANVMKITHMLRKAGYIASQRGREGGYVLTSKGENMTMLQLFEAVAGKYSLPDADQPLADRLHRVVKNELRNTYVFKGGM
jgi:DNA-binding IscR family transcriptional regulator